MQFEIVRFAVLHCHPCLKCNDADADVQIAVLRVTPLLALGDFHPWRFLGYQRLQSGHCPTTVEFISEVVKHN